MSVAIIDYNAGNVRSVLYAMERLGVDAVLTDDHAQIRAAEKVIFPGVGEASTTMAFLKEKGLDELIRSLTQPVLGICLGMQLLCEYSEENDTPCLGIIPQQVKRFRPQAGEKVPHMGWNSLLPTEREGGNPIFTPDLKGEYVYFVHSYYVEKGPYTTALTDYVQPFSCGLQKDNFYATQFHPEKSGAVGERIIKNFLNL
jgi:glutamine amidotransferase